MALIRGVIFSSTYWCQRGSGPAIVSIHLLSQEADACMAGVGAIELSGSLRTAEVMLKAMSPSCLQKNQGTGGFPSTC